MRRKGTAGIYRITSPSGKIYIGRSYNIEQRWRTYRRLDCKDQPLLYNSLVKYRADKHKFAILHEFPSDVSLEILEHFEVHYFNQYRCSGCKMLNLGKVGRGIGKLTAEQSAKAGSYHKGKPTWTKGKFGKEHNKSVGVICDGVEYGSISEASRATGISISTLHYAMRNTNKLRNGMEIKPASI